jgi:hypothetical protein
MKRRINIWLKIGIVISYLAMVVVNALANILPLNNLSTGQISQMYSNLFTPAGFTFAIWGVIYLLLGAYVLYSIGVFGKPKIKEEISKKIGIWFIITSLANIAWIFSWHYNLISLSIIFMLVLLVSLIKIWLISYKEKFGKRERFFITLPFSIYFGWITVATIANFTVLLVSENWNNFGVSPEIWTILLLLIGTVIYLAKFSEDRNILYSLVFVWAYFGILMKHLSTTGFNEQYLGIILTIMFCMIVFVVSISIGLIKRK